MIGAIPAGIWDQATHPAATIDQLLAGPDMRNGQWGAAAGTWLSMAAVGPRAIKTMASPQIRTLYARNMADKNAPRPRVPTVDEMLAGPHLDSYEHHDYGHTIRRHINVDNDYLLDRLDNGTLLDSRERGHEPPTASAWNDLPTAEAAITRVVQHHEAAIRAFAAGAGDGRLVLDMDLGVHAGRAMFRLGTTVMTEPSSMAIVVLRRRDGQVFIGTAYLGRP